ncbi:hypothetical protein GCM10025794_00470 [Massilia kyonggiensis]
MARYGPWYLLRGQSGKWHTCWWHVPHDEKAMESFIFNDDSLDEDCFPTRREALKEILRSLDSEIGAGGAGYITARQRVRDSLISNTNEHDAGVAQNEFLGTPDEAALIEEWIRSDQREAAEYLAAAKRRATFEAACTEQERRERVFEEIVRVFGARAIEEINAAIEDAWLTGQPKISRTVDGLKRDETMPMPQLAVISGAVVFCSSSRATPIPVRTPLSKRDAMNGYVPHWKHSTWLGIVIPALVRIIDRLEREAQASPPNGTKNPELS